MTDADRELIVKSHNHFRGAVHLYNGGKKASNMLRISYDRELENLAQLWAGNCQFAHDKGNDRYIPGKYSTGQNLALGATNWATVLQLWHSESNNFNYDAPPTNGKTVGHYTQMVWAESTRVGCGMQLCNGSAPLYVCNYAPTGNMADRANKPYEVGDWQEDCPTHYNTSTGFCECTRSMCYNGGTVDTKSCTCRCPTVSWLEASEDCAIMCGLAEDSGICSKWGQSYCELYTNVRAEYCPYMCNVCIDEDEIPPPTMPHNYTSTPLSRPDGYGVSVIRPDKPYCSKEEPALCGQPNRKTGYLPQTVCLNRQTANICPAMCGSCSARKCRDYEDNSYNLGESWINMYGRFTCTSGGVKYEQGCQSQDRKDIVPINSSVVMQHEDGVYNCHCGIGDDDVHRMNCVPQTFPYTSEDDLDDCEGVEGARCGLPRRGSYWLKSHCKLKMVRRLCPAMCKICHATLCRNYLNEVVGIGTENHNDKNGLYVCTAAGWVVGPAITIQSENSTGLPVYAVIAPTVPTNNQLGNNPSIAPTVTDTRITSRVTLAPFSSLSTISAQKPAVSSLSPVTPVTPVTSVTQPITTITEPVAAVTEPVLTQAQQPSSTQLNVNPAAFDFDGFDLDYVDPYADDYLETDNDDDEDLTESDAGSGYAEETDDDEVDNLGDSQQPKTPHSRYITKPVSTPTNPTSRQITTPTTATSTTGTATTTESTPITTQRRTLPTTSTRTTKQTTSPTTTSTTTTPTTTTQTTTSTTRPTTITRPTSSSNRNTDATTRRSVQAVTGFRIGSPVVLRANQDLASSLFPNKSEPCRQADQAYCNQPLPGNTSSTFRVRDCAVNPLVCPGLCGLCTVTQCQDYSRQIYSVGESWHSLYARMTCGRRGVSSERGCYYELLRTFIEAGESLEREDGFLIHSCQCNVSLADNIWSHDLQCSRSVSTDQRLTVAPKEGFCEHPDDHRCTDPYYTPRDCTFIHVAMLCGAMCGKCKVSQCKDSIGGLHEVGGSWITTLGKMVCTETGLRTVRGCKFTQQNTFIEQDEFYKYSSRGTDYTCTCEKTSAYRYQLTCTGRRKIEKADSSTTLLPPRHELTTVEVTTSLPIAKCQRMDNPKCGQMATDFWSREMCESKSTGWKKFMNRVCPALCSVCQTTQCRGYEGKAYNVGETWIVRDVEHMCTAYGINFSQ